MLVTSTPDGPATGTHSKMCNTANTTPADPITASTNDTMNVPLPLTEDRKDTLRPMQKNRCLLQMYFQEITQWQISSHEVNTFTQIKGVKVQDIHQCKGARCIASFMYISYSYASVYGQLRFSLYSGAVITRTQF